MSYRTRILSAVDSDDGGIQYSGPPTFWGGGGVKNRLSEFLLTALLHPKYSKEFAVTLSGFSTSSLQTSSELPGPWNSPFLALLNFTFIINIYPLPALFALSSGLTRPASNRNSLPCCKLLPLFIQKSDYFLSQRKPPTEFLQLSGWYPFLASRPTTGKKNSEKTGTAPDDDTHTRARPKKGRKSSNLQKAAKKLSFKRTTQNWSRGHRQVPRGRTERERISSSTGGGRAKPKSTSPVTPGELGTASRSLTEGKQARER